jgi:hypothetical protein
LADGDCARPAKEIADSDQDGHRAEVKPGHHAPRRFL